MIGVFMVRISVLDRFTAELCNAVLGREDSAAVLAHIASNMFLVASDRGHFNAGADCCPTYVRSSHLVEDPSPSLLAVPRWLAKGLSRREIDALLYDLRNTFNAHASELNRGLGATSHVVGGA